MYNYSDIYNELNFNIGLFVFFKKDASVRVMIGTRCLDIAKIKYGWISGELSKMDNRCSIKNGNIGLIDLTIGEGRCFNIGRLVEYHNLGKVENEEQYEAVMKNFMEFATRYKNSNPDIVTLGMGMLDNPTTGVTEGKEIVGEFSGNLTI